MNKLITCALAAGTLAFATGAHAQLVVNGGFETGDFTGWTESGAVGSVYGVDTAGPHQGSFSAFFGASTPAAWISQTITTIPGTTYQVSFWFDRSPDTTSGIFAVTFGGGLIYSDPGTTFAFAPISVNVMANSSSTVLMFSANNNSDFYTLDNVGVSVVPEPAAPTLLAMGLAGLALWRRRQR